MTHPTFLGQWSETAQSAAKKHEFTVYIPPLMKMLGDHDIHDIIDFQADEGVVSKAFCRMDPVNHASFVAITEWPGLLEKAQDETAALRAEGRIDLVTSLDELNAAAADAILFNNILGCLGTMANVDDVLTRTETLVRPGGYAAVTFPNPDDGRFSSYTCSDLPLARAVGETYSFLMKGEADPYINLYLTEPWLTSAFARHGFGLVEKHDVADQPYEDFVSDKPAFRQYLFQNGAPV